MIEDDTLGILNMFFCSLIMMYDTMQRYDLKDVD